MTPLVSMIGSGCDTQAVVSKTVVDKIKMALTLLNRPLSIVWISCELASRLNPLVLCFPLLIDQKSFSTSSTDSLTSSSVPNPIEIKSFDFAFSAMNWRPSAGGILPAPSVLIRMKGLGVFRTMSIRSCTVSGPL